MNDFIISNIVTQAVYFIGFVFVFGFVISYLNKTFYRLIRGNRFVCYATGFIGTPVHELSHALMCVIFGHKIREMKLFQIDEESGTLGYVNHAYNKKSVYQVLGNYFIGIAPIFCGSVLIYFAMRSLLPNAYMGMTNAFNDLAALQAKGISAAWFENVFLAFGEMMEAVFSDFSVGGKWWLFMVGALCIALHMNLSGADIKGAIGSLPILLILLIGANFLLGHVFYSVYIDFNQFMNMAGGYLLGILIFSCALSVLYVLLAVVLKFLFSLFGIGRR